MTKVPARHLRTAPTPTHPQHLRCLPDHLVTYLLSMRANGTLRPGETLHTGREKSQAGHALHHQHPPFRAWTAKT